MAAAPDNAAVTSAQQDFAAWLEDLRSTLLASQPDLLPLFDVFANEARFGRAWLDSDLAALPYGSKVLEVGAGALLLSCQLAREGFSVTALEPLGDGFSSFLQLQALVRRRAAEDGIFFEIIDQTVEALAVENTYRFAYSINVMEHIQDVSSGLTAVCRSLADGGRYRFTCANYLFPYEPHFDLPTLFSKSLTQKLLWQRIVNSRRVAEPDALWHSLNWINQIQVARTLQRIAGCRFSFDKGVFERALERMSSDAQFAGRRSRSVRLVAALLVRCGMHRLARFLPACMLPIIDCTIDMQRAQACADDGR